MKIPSVFVAPTFLLRLLITHFSRRQWMQSAMVLTIALLPSAVMAATKTWNNVDGNTDWNTGTNWTSTGIPESGDSVAFSGAAAASPNISTSTTVNALASDATASGYTISADSGQSLTLMSAGSGGGSVINFQNTSGTNTISANLILGQAAAATATFNQTIGGNSVFSGDISSTSAIAGLFIVTQGSTTLSGNNTYSGITTLIGALNINSATAISSGSLIAQANVVLGNTSGAAITLTHNNNITLNNTLAFTSDATTGDLSFGSGVVTLNGGGRTILVTNAGSTLKIGSLDADTTARTLTIGSSGGSKAPDPTFGKLSIANAAAANLQGTIKFTGGVLEIGNKSALGTGTIEWQNDHGILGVKTFMASTELTGANAVANAMQLGVNGNNLGPAIIGGSHAIEFSGTLTPVGNSRTLTINNTALTTFSGDVKLPTVGVFSLTINGSGNTLISGAISPFTGLTSAGLTYAGTGKLTLSNSGNTYSGATTVNSGTIAYGANQATPSASAVTINATTASGSATLDLAGYDSTISTLLTFGGATAGANTTNTLSTGSGTLTLVGNAFYTKATLSANDPGTATISGNLALSGGQRTFVVDDSTNTTNELNVTAVVSSTDPRHGVTKKNAGTMTLSAANTYIGPTYIQEGILSINSIGDVNGGASALGAPTTASTGTISLGYTTTTGQLTYTGGASTTDRIIDLRGMTGGGIVDQSGTGLLKFTSNLTATGAGIKTLTLQGSTTGTGEIGGIIRDNSSTNTTSLVKAGTGTWTLSNANTYTGATTVNAGTLAVTDTGSINASSGVSVSGTSAKLRYDSSVGLTRDVTAANGGTFAYNAAANYTGTFTSTNGKLGGTNWNGTLGGLTIGTGQSIAPGNSVGAATSTTQIWAGGGSYDFEINQADGTAGLTAGGWDLLTLSGALSITATTENPFNLNVISLGLDNLAGNATGFVTTSDYAWLIADTGSAINSFSATALATNTTGFTNSHDGTWALVLGNSGGIGGTDQQLYLTYTAAIPEPASLAFIGGALVLLTACRRRRA